MQSTPTGFPSLAQLEEFFRMGRRSRVPLHQLAPLLGLPEAGIRAILKSEGVPIREGSVAWGVAAVYLFDAWPRAAVIGALHPEVARRIPTAFQPVHVTWTIPLFIVYALRYQATVMRAMDPRIDPAARGRLMAPLLDDYIADLLFNEIQPTTVAALSHDRAFVDAYTYPPVG